MPQSATISSIGCMGMLNVGVQLGLAGHATAAGAALALSAVCAGLVLYSFRRVKRLDKFGEEPLGAAAAGGAMGVVAASQKQPQ